MKLSTLFGDNMVLQRGAKNLLWGYDRKNSRITGTYAGRDFTVLTDEKGYFETELPQADAGGPYQLHLIGEEEITIQDICVGDVFLLGGQSNMELPLSRTLDLFEKELRDLQEPELRVFEVPKEYEFAKVREELQGGSWKPVCGLEGLLTSGVGFFLAKKLRETHSVPIGLLAGAVGGTPLQAWCSEETLVSLGEPLDELCQCKDNTFIREVQEADQKREIHWYGEAEEGFEKPSSKKGTLQVPGLWKNTFLNEYHGSMILEKEIEIAPMAAEKEGILYLGAMIDWDKVYINDRLVGETGYKYPPRKYIISPGVLRPGLNKIRIELCVCRESGGFISDKVYELRFRDEAEKPVDLTGTWGYTYGKQMPELPNPVFFQYKPTGLYKGMIYPLRKWKIAAILFYQGESNTHEPWGYARLMEAMISDWRSLFQRENLPFIYVQLPGFAEVDKQHIGTKWAILREEQRKVLKVPFTAMAVTIDVGEYNDLHPQDKKTVGNRLALAVRNLVYGENVEYSGPTVSYVSWDEDSISLTLTHVENGLPVGEIVGFEGRDKDGIWEKLGAYSEEEKILISWKKEGICTGIRYAWADNPKEAVFYNKGGLPAAPFMIERS